MPNRCIASVSPNSALMYHRNVRIIDIFLSRIALEAIGATISFVVLSFIFVFFELMGPPEDALKVVGAWLLTAWFGAALAILLGAWSEKSELVEKLFHPAAYLMFPISGAAFLVDALPKDFQEVVLWLPMVHGTEMVREGYFGSKMIAHYDVGYLVMVNMILTLAGLAIERIVTRDFVPE
jgi:ABC-type polysaccharide/polyol phosphate export permease